ncbi:MAG: 50S ribosomal protein L11 methyltransferase, partial [Deltaproteobacteria bacterium]|nr:50S ribosomal protein L11 methyltransferase [Deltaproteobacteria bacterium]
SSQPQKNFFKKIELESSSDQKWATEYLKYLQPIHLKTNHPILSSLVIDPRGEKPLKKSSNTLYLDPSLAFGTGAHPTTALCAELLCSQFDPKKKSLLDVGTGSGILAMIGNKIGFNPVVGIDNDPIAIEVAEQNQKRNGLKGMLFQDHFRTLRKFDLIVANILLPTLIDLKTHFEKHLKANGTLIVSGLLYKDAAPLLKKYSNWVLIERKNKKGWTALLLKKKALRKT